MDAKQESSIPAWIPEHDEVLQEVSTSDNVDVSKWTMLRDVIKQRIDQNIALFLSGQVKGEYNRSTVKAAPRPGGLKLPSFPSRPRDPSNPNEAPKNILTEQEAADFKQSIFAQLDEFEQSPPFTIQRLCELCLRPTEHYKFLGKYLRAVEKTLLVTSTWDAFPISQEQANGQPAIGHAPVSINTLSAPTTPIFSPIPFLHEDARRSSSRSPPPSPLVLPAMEAATTMPHAGAESSEQKALGLVDELDDPSPGHLSEHPQALSATTTVTSPKPLLLGSLEERFVKAKTDSEGEGSKGGKTE